jgi:hypothetical protein
MQAAATLAFGTPVPSDAIHPSYVLAIPQFHQNTNRGSSLACGFSGALLHIEHVQSTKQPLA